MSILGSNKITEEWLRRNGFKKEGWGSISTRKQKNTTCWSKVVVVDSYETFEIIWFPEGFEGYVTSLTDAQNHVMIMDPYGSGLGSCESMHCDDIDDMIVFVGYKIEEFCADWWDKEQIMKKIKWQR